MSLETELISICKPIVPTFFGHYDVNSNQSELPVCVINYLNDSERRDLDNTFNCYSGRITFTLYAKKEKDILPLKNSLRTALLDAPNFNFTTNDSLSDYDDSTKCFLYQLDFDFVYLP